MLTKTFDAQVRQERGIGAAPVAVIDLHGEINSLAEESLNKAYAEAASSNTNSILLNFSGVSYINSTGIALIVGLLAQPRKSGRRLLTAGLSDHYLEIFQITRLSDFMSIFPDESAALKSF
jgi:anti-sigma B factor antagonist